jgi:hypothetical protein
MKNRCNTICSGPALRISSGIGGPASTCPQGCANLRLRILALLHAAILRDGCSLAEDSSFRCLVLWEDVSKQSLRSSYLTSEESYSINGLNYTPQWSGCSSG